MHDCRTNGGHFFVHRPQGHAFRCRRCSERFADSWSPTGTSPTTTSPTTTSPTTPTTATEQRKHPWRCIIERCEYVACDPCSSILMEELAAGGGGAGGADEKVAVGEEWGEREREREGERGGGMEVMEVMEVDEEEEEEEGEAGEGGEGARYVVPAVVCRTARQAAAEAAMKRAYVKRAPVRHGARGE